ncbi:MAG TPA: hypothetical protein ENH20_00085 [Candidatus Pacearchaeota archaeon]|nr:hypothetical protein [Candidatus Pacearchaeota archaeon]
MGKITYGLVALVSGITLTMAFGGHDYITKKLNNYMGERLPIHEITIPTKKYSPVGISVVLPNGNIFQEHFFGAEARDIRKKVMNKELEKTDKILVKECDKGYCLYP